MTWIQPVCQACWDKDHHPDEQPNRLTSPTLDGMERCCLCGAATTAGIWARYRPAAVPYPRKEPTCGEIFYGYMAPGEISGMDFSVPRICTLPSGHRDYHGYAGEPT